MASITDVAKRAGVSVASVSRVLNASKPVGPETRARVLAAVRDLNYSIDGRARALKLQKSGTLGLIISDVSNPFFGLVIRAIEAVAYEGNHSLFLCNSDEDPDRERFHVRAMLTQRIGGVLVLPVTTSGGSLLPLIDQGVPVMCLDRRVDDMDLDTVLVDNVAGAMLAVSHLVARGHRRIGVITGRESTPSLDRVVGYHKALVEHGIAADPELILPGYARQDSGYLAATALLELAVPPTAIFSINHPMTLGVLAAIRDKGLRVPRDISVVGFDDSPWAPLLDPPLTTIAQPTDALGTRAAQLLLERVDGQYTGSARHVVLASTLIQRGSTGPTLELRGRTRDLAVLIP